MFAGVRVAASGGEGGNEPAHGYHKLAVWKPSEHQE